MVGKAASFHMMFLLSLRERIESGLLHLGEALLGAFGRSGDGKIGSNYSGKNLKI
jgi:hypothetical protein